MDNIKGQWVSDRYKTKFPQESESQDLYWFSIPIGSIVRKYENAGWSEWHWCSGSSIGDRMGNYISNNFAEIHDWMINKFSEQVK